MDIDALFESTTVVDGLISYYYRRESQGRESAEMVRAEDFNEVTRISGINIGIYNVSRHLETLIEQVNYVEENSTSMVIRSAEDLERWARRAFREWALRPRPLATYLRILLDNPALLRPALEIGLESFGWARG